MKARSGFTLIEILVSLLVFVLAATSIMAVFTVAAAAHRHGMDNARARLIAGRVFSEVRTNMLRELKPKDLKDAVAPEFGGIYKYDVTFKTAAQGNAFLVTVTVKLPSESGAVTEVFQTVLPRRYP